MARLFLTLVAALTFVACDKAGSIDGTKNRASAEQEAANNVENSNLTAKAKRMEAELAERHRYYGAVEGQYLGTVSVDDETYSMRLTLVRSIPPYHGDRIRQLSEIESDLNGLHFQVHAVQWLSSNTAASVGCRASLLKPNMDTGVLSVSSADCNSTYTILLSEEGVPHSQSEMIAQQVAQKIKANNLHRVDYLMGRIQPTANSRTYWFALTRAM